MNAVMPLGIRNNNPWNLQQEHIKWLGLTSGQPVSGELKFDNLLDGIRAGVKLCYTYQNLGFDNVTTWVTKFSPPPMNPTAQYIKNMCKWTGFGPMDKLDFHDTEIMVAWAKGVFRQEQGDDFANAIMDDTILAGIALAEGE